MNNENLRTCLLCKSILTKKAFPFYTNYNGIFFEYFKCIQCSATCIHPRPDKLTLKKIYNKDTYHNKFYSTEDHEKYSISVLYLEKFIKKNLVILDYGCGAGYFLKALEKKNYKVMGVDFEEDLINNLNKKYNTFTISEFENNENLNNFDVIHLGDVLEHLVNPIEIINLIIKRIKPGGYLYIEGPLERNLSFVNFSILLYGNFRNLFFFFKKRNHTPTHLFFVNLITQLNFFNQFTSLSIVNYKVYETGWPYVNQNFFKSVIAKLSIFLSGKKLFSNIFGNVIYRYNCICE